MQEIKIPEKSEKYEPEDLKLLPGETVEAILERTQLSKIRTYAACAFLAILGSAVTASFLTEITTEKLAFMTVVFLAFWLLWRGKSAGSLLQLIASTAKFLLIFVLLNYTVYFTILSLRILPPGAATVRLDPLSVLSSMLAYSADILRRASGQLAPYAAAAGLLLVAISIACAAAAYRSCRSQLYYITNRRIVIRRRFGTRITTNLPLEKISEITAFQGFLGRLLGFGDIILTMQSGSGAVDDLAPEPIKPLSGLYTTSRKLEGVKDVWKVRDLIATLADFQAQKQKARAATPGRRSLF